MNLPSHTTSSTDPGQNGAVQSYEASTNLKASDHNTPGPIVNNPVNMTVSPSPAALSAASSTRSSPKAQLHALKTQGMAHHDQASTPSPQTYPSPSPSALPSALSEHSPSPHTRTPVTGAVVEPISASKSPGLIRRLSRGASQRIRRKTSHQQSLRMRDQSAGPVLVRRRSDSNGASDYNMDMSDFELDNSMRKPWDDARSSSKSRMHANGLGIDDGRMNNMPNSFEGGIAASFPPILLTGCSAMKHGNKNQKPKRLRIWLDPDSARICWHPTNASKSFFIDDVREVRVGAESRNARNDAQIPEEHEGRWMTIVYEPPERSKGRTIKTMHLVMESEGLVNHWAQAVKSVTRERSDIMNALASSTEKSEKAMALAWKQAMSRKGVEADHEQRFMLDDARWLCRKLEINCSDNAVKTHFLRSDSARSGSLDYAQYQDFVNSFKERKDLQHVFRNVSYGTELDIHLDGFLDFLKNDQRVDVEKDRSYWEGIFDKFARPSQNRAALPDAEPVVGQRALTKQAFQNFMTSSYNPTLIAGTNEVTLDRPFNEYFISSSHNTYLLGRQVRGESSVEGYIDALVKGCRCIEIDCWDGEGGRPMVTHGRTMTSKVSFEDCVSTIAKYAFHSSPYPLIVSLEVHCNPEQQLAMVDLMSKYWRNTMITEPITPNAVSLPSPEDLRGKIVVKVKAAAAEVELLPIPAESINGRSRARSLGTTFVRTPSIDKYSIKSTSTVSSPPATSPSETNLTSVAAVRGPASSGLMTPSSSADDSDDALLDSEKPRKRKTKIIHELGKLGVYAQGIKYGGFDIAESKTPNHIFSFAENTFDKLCMKHGDNKSLLETHNLRYLMRVYPMARRIDSSNFNPLRVWRRGVQMAALNWQTFDVHQQVNAAMFAAGTDRLGYVLKPAELRPSKHTPIAETIPDVPAVKDKKGKKIVRFTVDIVSAYRLPRPRSANPEHGMNPYIEFEMYSAEDKAPGNAFGEGGTDASARDGSSGIGSPLRKRTKIVEGNNFDPIYNQPITMTVETKHTSLIFVRWTVWNAPDGRPGASSNVLLATFTAKLSSLQQGYRHLPLFNPRGEQYRDAKLFVKIRKEAPISSQHKDGAFSVTEPAPSPRADPIRTEKPWRSRVFSRNSSHSRKTDRSEDGPGVISRTTSVDRDSIR